MPELIDARYLDGLSYSFAETVAHQGECVECGIDENFSRTRTATRPLTQEDVLYWEDQGEVIGFTTSDGKEYHVPKIQE